MTDLASAVDGAGDAVGRLAAVRELNIRVTGVAEEAVRTARSSGVAWRVIGECLGVSKQAVAKRFADAGLPHPPAERREPDGSTSRGRAGAAVQVVEMRGGAESVARRSRASWEVRTPGGRTLLHVERSR